MAASTRQRMTKKERQTNDKIERWFEQTRGSSHAVEVFLPELPELEGNMEAWRWGTDMFYAFTSMLGPTPLRTLNRRPV
jgi:hypothetical protein